jgi:hypothetical protein
MIWKKREKEKDKGEERGWVCVREMGTGRKKGKREGVGDHLFV